MLQREVYFDILENLSRKDLDTLLVTNRQLRNLSTRVSSLSKRQISLGHFQYTYQFVLYSKGVRRAVHYADLPGYLNGSQLTDVRIDGSMLDRDSLQGRT